MTGLLDGPRARGAFVLRSSLQPPWSLLIEDGAPLSVITVITGSAYLRLTGDTAPRRLLPGDVAVVSHGVSHVVSDDPERAPAVVIGPGQTCLDSSGGPSPHYGPVGLRGWGNSPTGPDVLVTGTYQLRAETGRRLLAALPPLLVHSSPEDRSLLRWFEREVGRDEPGQAAVLDRLLDLVLVAALRGWFSSSPQEQVPGWYVARADPVLGPVVRVLEDHPEWPWTVASLAAVGGVSRSALARRFRAVVGEPPLTYLTHRRLDVAADLLLQPDVTLASVALQVGYGSPFALSAAFTRVRGVSPQAYRRAGGAGRSGDRW